MIGCDTQRQERLQHTAGRRRSIRFAPLHALPYCSIHNKLASCCPSFLISTEQLYTTRCQYCNHDYNMLLKSTAMSGDSQVFANGFKGVKVITDILIDVARNMPPSIVCEHSLRQISTMPLSSVGTPKGGQGISSSMGGRRRCTKPILSTVCLVT